MITLEHWSLYGWNGYVFRFVCMRQMAAQINQDPDAVVRSEVAAGRNQYQLIRLTASAGDWRKLPQLPVGDPVWIQHRRFVIVASRSHHLELVPKR